ncbi:MAG: Gfo/Idh/MocA family oxidoreductase [Chitinophagaceae bacterium]|nr:Gfo/Idh/MocA family oxidoreductase [Chitinophagaceae bacterium]
MSLRQFISARRLLRSISFLTENVTYGWKEIARMFGLHEDLYYNSLHKKLVKPVEAILIGAGHRGTIYASYALENPDELLITGVADPNHLRMSKTAKLHHIPQHHCFSTWEHIFEREKFADAVIIATPDQLHTAPCLRALEMGYDVLLEKPVAPTEAECRHILDKARQTGRIVGVCHVLRYTPYFRELKEILDAKIIGEIISVQHLEPIEHVHMSHSYVRGKWRNSKNTTPIILAKSCHDTDIIRWLVNDPADNVHCFGNLKWFTTRNAPDGSTERCTDGCAVENDCPYSALQIYYRDKKRLYVFDLSEDKSSWDEEILHNLKTTDYGRCVYRMDNDQPDHLTVNILFKNGVTAAFSMEAHVSYEGRRTRIMGSKGDIAGDMETFIMTDFKTGRKTTWNLKTDAHGGGDHLLVKDWVQAVAQQNPALLSSSIDVSVESHIMAFAAEKSRQSRTIEDVII